jgi:tetratricopeptide (TPR) repeat protein
MAIGSIAATKGTGGRSAFITDNRDSFILCWDQKVASITRYESPFDMRWFGKMGLMRAPSILLTLVVGAIEAVASELAIQDCNELLRQYPYLVEAALLRASVDAKLGNYAQSLKEVDHIVSIRPRTDGLARALSQRAWLMLTARDSALHDAPQALKDAKQACNLMLWKDADMIDTLAVAYAANGDFDSAVKYEEKALRTKEITPEEAKTCQEHLASFKQNWPFWQSP